MSAALASPTGCCRLRGSWFRLLRQIFFRQTVAEIVTDIGLVPRTETALYQKLQIPRFCHVEAKPVRHLEQCYLAQTRCAFGHDIADTGMVLVAETYALPVLHQLDAVKDTAAHISGALERIGSVARNQDRLTSWLQPLLQTFEAILAKQADTDRWHRYWRNIKLDEFVFGIGCFGVFGGTIMFGVTECLCNVTNRQFQAADRTVTDQCLPVLPITDLQINRALRIGCGDLHRRITEPPTTNEPDGRTNDAVSHDEHSNRGTADDFHLRRLVLASRDSTHVTVDQRVQRSHNLRFGNADQHDRLFVVDQFYAAYDAFGINADDNMDRLAGITDGTGEIRIQISITDYLTPLHQWCDWRLALRLANSIGLFEERACLNLGKVFFQISGGCCGLPAERQNHRRQRDDPGGF